MTGESANSISLGNLSLGDSSNNSSPDQVIPQLHSSLKTFLERLKETVKVNVTRPRTVLSSSENSSLDPSYLTQTDRVSLTPQAIELDESVIALLTYIGNQFSVWIFSDFVNSNSLQVTLWSSFHYLSIKYYQQLVLGNVKVSGTDEVTRKTEDLNQQRYINLCKQITYFYKQFITRLIEKFGYTPQIHFVVSSLRLTPDNLSSPTNVIQKIIPTIHLSIHDTLCHMGDLSRYLSALEDQSTEITKNYSHALIYYTTASKIAPSSGVPLNQLGSISYSRGDLYSATCYFLRSVAVDEPFKDTTNLRVMLRKISKIKDSAFASTPIFGLRDSEYEDKETIGKVKETLLQTLQLFSNLYLAQISAKGEKQLQISSVDLLHSENHQKELAKKIYNHSKKKEIPSRILVSLVIIAIVFVWLLKKSADEQEKDLDLKKKPSKAYLTPRSAYKSALSFTLKIFDQLLSVTLKYTTSSNLSLCTEKKLPSEIGSLLPVFRILFDWMHKQMADDSITSWGQDMSECNAIFLKSWQLIEFLRQRYNFDFDVLTSVAKSNWDRFDEVLKQQTYAISSSNEDDDSFILTDTLEGQDGNGGTSMGSQAVFKNYEETHSFGLLALNGGLSDTPTGLESTTSSRRSEQDLYRSQCILFSAVEMSRLSFSFLILDEFKGNNATFVFEQIEFEQESFSDDETSQFPETFLPPTPGFGVLGPGTLNILPTGPQSQFTTNSYPYENQEEQVVNESEYYSIGRNNTSIIKDTFSNGSGGYGNGHATGYSSVFGTLGKNGSGNGKPGSQELFNPMNAMNSASPAFLNKLYNLEQAQFSKNGKSKKKDAKSSINGKNGKVTGVPASTSREGTGSNTPANDVSDDTTPGSAKSKSKRRRRRNRKRKRGDKPDSAQGNDTSVANSEDSEDDEGDSGEGVGNTTLNSTSLNVPNFNTTRPIIEEDSDDEDSDEQVVFAGRGRG